MRLEVIQSADKQAWHAPDTGPSPPVYSIAQAQGYWYGANRMESTGCLTHINLFAWHAGTGSDTDQRGRHTWDSFVIAARYLPDQKRISASAEAAVQTGGF